MSEKTVSEKNRNIELSLNIEDAVMQTEKDIGSQARLRPTVCVDNKGNDLINIGGSNFKFQLVDQAGETIEDLGVALSDKFKLTKDGQKQSFSCLLRADSLGIKPGKTYKLCVEAFDKKCETEFQFAAH